MVSSAASTQPDSAKRKVRKGTHSCWECRRRKTRCQFSAQGDTICIGCKNRGSACVSQEFSESTSREAPDRRLAQRLNRLENLMEKLVEKMVPPGAHVTTNASATESSSHTNPSSDTSGSPMMSASTPVTTSSASQISRLERAAHQINLVSPPSQGANQQTKSAISLWQETLPGTHANVNASLTSFMPTTRPESPPLWAQPLTTMADTLFNLLPSQEACRIILYGSPANIMVVQPMGARLEEFSLYGAQRLADAVPLPKRTDHPLIIAIYVMQIAICLQHLLPSFDSSGLGLSMPRGELAKHMTSTTWSLIGTNDELMTSLEGLRFLQLHAFYHKNAGNLRRSWLCCRRSLGFIQLMGLDRPKTSFPGTSRLNYTDAKSAEYIENLYFRVLSSDRSMSLLLGLPGGSSENNYIRPSVMVGMSKMDKFERKMTYAASRVIERNRSSPDQAYSLTLEIHKEIEETRAMMGVDWFALPTEEDMPSIDNISRPAAVEKWTSLMYQLQISSLTIFLHLPYLLRDATEQQWGSSKRAAMAASREVLYRFVRFRSMNSAAFCFRFVDYSAFVGAMTLILGYLGRSPPSSGSSEDCARTQQCGEDRRLVMMVVETMRDVSALNSDRLTSESADIIMQMLPIMDTWRALSPETRKAVDKYLHLTVPYLGVININTSGGIESPQSESGQQPQQPTPPSMFGSGDAGSAPLLGMETGRSLATSQTPESLVSLSTGGAQNNLFNTVPMSLSMSEMDSMPTLSSTSAYVTIDPGVSTIDPIMFDSGEGLDIPSEWADFGQSSTLQPGLVADGSDWLLQGVDTSYWSMLNGGFMQEY